MFIIHYSVVEHVLFDLFLSYPFTGWDIAMKHYSSLGPQKKKEKIYAARPSNFAWYNFFFDKFLQLFLFFPSFSYSLIIQCVQGDNEQKKGDQRAEQERERRTKPRSRFPPSPHLHSRFGGGENKKRWTRAIFHASRENCPSDLSFYIYTSIYCICFHSGRAIYAFCAQCRRCIFAFPFVLFLTFWCMCVF